MGHKKFNKVDVQKARLKNIFLDILRTNISIMEFQITLTDDPKDQKGLKRFVKETYKAMEIVTSITHYEILVSLYNTFLNGKETYFTTLCKTINNKNTIVKWDRTEKGFKLFLKLESDAKAKSKEEYEKKLKEQEMIKKAKAEGKKVEMVFVDGKLQPRIVEEKPS